MEITQEEGFSDFELILGPTADFWSPLMPRGATIKIMHPQCIADEITGKYVGEVLNSGFMIKSENIPEFSDF